jgi:hypothetical protein
MRSVAWIAFCDGREGERERRRWETTQGVVADGNPDKSENLSFIVPSSST